MLDFAVATMVAIVCIDVVGALVVIAGLAALWRDRRATRPDVDRSGCDVSAARYRGSRRVAEPDTEPFAAAYVRWHDAGRPLDVEHRRAGYWS